MMALQISAVVSLERSYTVPSGNGGAESPTEEEEVEEGKGGAGIRGRNEASRHVVQAANLVAGARFLVCGNTR
ncbi:uncharacterized protein LOC143212974 isoform X2 [Lasioglossum baleicum]|uniref:uncharacterized protein LOC143212974 isoform X2 n=1 Tax=Lasioglossum baleicum TaxID=434251 RepID=UPI003FCD7FD5